jgi:nitrogenase iron protein NifH
LKQIAIYGKGGIGKSTITTNVSVCLAAAGKKVVQIGCDPKHDSTQLLHHGRLQATVLDMLRESGPAGIAREDIVKTGYGGVLTIEAGGPEPGIGCAGRGIISMFEILEKLAVITKDIDVILYDVLGDVVCGGFAVPIRKNYAREIYIVTSGEFMSLYAANNICKCIARFAARGNGTLAGIIGNGRLNKPWEKELIEGFAKKVGSTLVAFFPRDEVFYESEVNQRTVMEYSPEHAIASRFRALSAKIVDSPPLVRPSPFTPEELERLVRRHG